MNKTKHNKNTFTILICFFIIGLFLFALIYESKMNARAATQIIDENQAIKILEIEPGNQFILGTANSNIDKNTDFTEEESIFGTLDTEKNDGTYKVTINGTNINIGTKEGINITHVTIQEFISQVDQINGKYDAVVIGRKNTGLKQAYANYNSATQTVSETRYIYSRDYSVPFSEKPLKQNSSTSWSTGYIPETYKNGSGNILNGGTINNKSYIEYYPENDITNKRANEIKALINSGQLVYIDDKVFNSDLVGSKLQTNFNALKDKVKCVKESSNSSMDVTYSNLLLSIINNHVKSSTSIKRTIFTVQAPDGDASNNIGSSLARNMKFKVNINGNITSGETLKLNLYLDLNGDGIFNDKELYSEENIKVSSIGTSKTLKYIMPNEFIGLLGWKVEVIRTVIDGNGNKGEVKSYQTGDITFKSLKDYTTTIKVLQITPSNGSLIYLNSNSAIINDLKTVRENGFNYNIMIDNKTINDFNNISNYEDYLKNYNMIILGFNDEYGIKSSNSSVDFDIDSIKALKDFAASGKSMMFTHDTMPVTVIGNLKSGSKMLGKYFRDYIGQSVYVDENNPTQKDIYQEYQVTKDSNGVITGGEYQDRYITHYNLLSSDSGKTSYGYISDIIGQTAQAGGNSQNSSYIQIQNNGTTVFKMNNGMMNNFPFQLANSIEVATTHHGYFQLNLEDPDLVPWYNLNVNSKSTGKPYTQYIDKYDARDNYYTYSKRNITFSGTGHSGGFTPDELRLFVNTMIKAERGGNHTPNIMCSIPTEYDSTKTEDEVTNKVTAGKPYTFTLDANDLDGDLVTLNTSIKDKSSENSVISVNEININTRNNSRIPSEITIPGDKLIPNTIIKVEVTVDDGKLSNTKTYLIKAIEAPSIDISADLTKFNTNTITQNVSSDLSLKDNLIKIPTSNDTINTEYTVTAKSFEYKKLANNTRKEIGIFIDSSINSNTWNGYLRENISKSIFGQSADSYLVKSKGDNVRFYINTYGTNSGSAISIDSHDVDQNKVSIDYKGQLQSNLLNINKGNNNKDIKDAIKDFTAIANSDEETDKQKTIIIISRQDISSIDISDLNDNYNILTLCLSNSSAISSDKPYEYENLWRLHKALGGLRDDYYVARPDNSDTDQYNEINNIIVNKMEKSLNKMKYPVYCVGDATLNFDLGNDIIPDPKDNTLIKNEISNNANKYMIKSPKIKYVVTDDSDNNLKYEAIVLYDDFNQEQIKKNDDTVYIVNFKIKLKGDQSGQFRFNDMSTNGITNENNDNNITYTDMVSTTFSKLKKLPIIELNLKPTEHGIYKGMTSSGMANLDNDKLHKFAVGSIVPVAANIYYLYDGNINLQIDDNCKFVGPIQIYSSDNLLIRRIDTDETTKNYQFKIDDVEDYSSIVVKYNVKLKETDEEKYTNNIQVVGEDKIPLDIGKSNNPLPDLF